MKLPISQRLLACSRFVRPGDRVADVGCDHGYLSIYLLDQGIARSVIASDINEGPLLSAVHNAEKFGVREKIEFFLSDGVKNIPRDFDTLICAGMGGETIMSILDQARWLEDSRYRLILQCQSKRSELRRWLYDAGYRICRETLAKDGKFVYSVMEVAFDPGHGITPAQCYLSAQLLEDAHPLLPEYYERVKHGVELTVFGLKRAGSGQLPIYESILTDLIQMEERIYGNRG